MSLLEKLIFYITIVEAKQIESKSSKILKKLFDKNNVIALLFLILIAFILIVIYLAIRMRRLNEYGSVMANTNRELRRVPRQKKTIEITFQDSESEEKDSFNTSDDNTHTSSVGSFINANKEKFITPQYSCSFSTISVGETYVHYQRNFNSHKEGCNNYSKDIKSMCETEKEIIPSCTALQLYINAPNISFEIQNMIVKFSNMKCTTIQIYKGVVTKQSFYNSKYLQSKSTDTSNKNQIIPLMWEDKFSKAEESINTSNKNKVTPLMLENKFAKAEELSLETNENIQINKTTSIDNVDKIRNFYVKFPVIRRYIICGKSGSAQKVNKDNLYLFRTSNKNIIKLLEENNEIVYEEI